MKTSVAYVVLVLMISGCSPQEPPAETYNSAIFESAFRNSVVALDDGTSVTFHTEELGVLKVPSGRIVALEPYVVRDFRPFTRSAPAGEYKVLLAIADYGFEQRIAFAKIVFSSAPVVGWQLAVPEGSKVKPGMLVGYAVDGGIGSFMDAEAARVLAVQREDEGFYGVLGRAIQSSKGPFRALIPAGEANVAVFASGLGDGGYASYYGLDALGRPVALITDFALVPWDR